MNLLFDPAIAGAGQTGAPGALSASLLTLGDGDPVDTGVLRAKGAVNGHGQGFGIELGRDLADQRTIEGVIASMSK